MHSFQAMEAFSENFIHRRIGSAIKGFAGGGPVGAVAGFATGGAQPSEAVAVVDPRTREPTVSACQSGFVWRNGRCERAGFIGTAQRIIPGGETGLAFEDDGFGAAVMGRYGAALVPMQIPSSRFKCPRGSKLGRDNLCYDHLHKNQRKWPPGTKPLLTGGEVNVLKKARRLEEKLKRLGVPIHVHKRRPTRKLLR